MKKIFRKTFAVLFAFFAILSVGCKNNKKTIGSVSVTGLLAEYYQSATIDFSNIKLNITYSDKSTETLSNCEFDIEVSNAKTETKFILYTSGLHDETAGNMTAGTYKIQYILIGEGSTKKDLMTVTVRPDNYQGSLFTLRTFSKPDLVKKYDSNIKNTTDESKYLHSYSADEQKYYVGDDNEFIFKPTFNLVRLSDNQVFTQNNQSLVLQTTAKVYLGSSEEPLTDNTYYTYNPATYGFQFTQAAIGKTFTLSVLPRDFDVVGGYDATAIEFNVTVADGWNAYTAKDLGRINFYDGDMATRRLNANDEDTQYTFNHIYGENMPSSTTNYNSNVMWRKFLNVSNDAEASINGIYIHADIEVTADDIPEEYFIKSEENAYAAGSLRDFSFLYYKYLDGNFDFNGNYFSISLANLPIQLSNRDYAGKYYNASTTDPKESHSKAFCFSGYYSDYFESKTTYTCTASIKNVNLIGNMKYENINDEDVVNSNISSKGYLSQEFANGGISGFESLYTQTTVDNVNIRNTYIGLYADRSYKAMEVTNSQIYDCFNCGIYSYLSEKNTVDNCILKRFGGPAIFVDSSAITSGANVGQKEHGASFTIDHGDIGTSIIESKLKGDEPWFTATTGASTLVGILEFINADLNGKNVSFITDDKFNGVGLCFTEIGNGANRKEIYSEYISKTGIPFVGYELPQNDPNYATFYATLGAYITNIYEGYGAPLIYTSNGGIYYFQLNLETGNHSITQLVADTNYSATDDVEDLLYIMLYQENVGAYGIVVSYNHI